MTYDIAFWTPINARSGFGHFYRMLGLFQKIKNNHLKVVYFTNEDFILLENIDVLKYKSNNLNKIILFLKNLEVKILIIDNYAIKNEQISLLNKFFRLVVFDSEFNNYKVDALINFNPFSIDMYPSKHKDTHYFLGLEYMIYRDSLFKEKDVQEERNSVFINIGGSDINKITYKLISLLPSTFLYHIVLGKGCSSDYYEKVKNKLKKENLSFFIYHQPHNFFHIMAKCQFSITSCSTTIYELLFFKKPFFCINVIDNQNRLCKYLSNNNINTFTHTNLSPLHGKIDKNIFKKLKPPDNPSINNDKLINYIKYLV